MANYNNFAQRTNWIAGSDKFEKVPMYLTTVNIPGINFSHPEVGGRNSTKINLGGDTISYNNLTFDMLVDEDMMIYKELMSIVYKNVDVNNGTFKDFYFDFWIELNNNKGNHIMKLEFFNCRLESISDIILDAQDSSTEFLLSVELQYDYFEIINNPTLELRPT
ncbi:tail completion and sheath stabilizer protein [Vibrio phage phiKT1024]|nr:tail completion and sheath stabilizer protein [Vibrio phage phiKT1024]